VVDGSALAGRVVAVAPKADGVARTARVLIDVAPAPGTPQWPEGLPVRVVLVAATKADAVVVPRSAVLFEGPRAVVFVKDKDAFKKVDVHLGARDDRHFEVKEGLVPGDVVVVSGVYALAQTRPAGAPAAPAADGHGHKH
jgi:multidrug efflux pump subunit AcrA (membrane-fusion protein)